MAPHWPRRRRSLAAAIAALATAAGIMGFIQFGRRRLPPGARRWRLHTPDGTVLSMALLTRNSTHALVIAHGLGKRLDNPGVLRLARAAAARMDVILYDQAGHGESSGVATLDPAHMAGYLAAVLHDARRRGYSRVGVLGLSLGAATAIHAAAQRAPVDAVASVSCPAAPPQAPGWAHENAWLARTVRAWYGLLGTRLEAVPRWRNAAIEVVATVAPCPLLVVHCGRDTLISRESSEALYVAAREPRAWILDDRAFHAAPHESVTSILAWLDGQLGA